MQFSHYSVTELLELIEQRQRGRLFVKDLEVQSACQELRQRKPTRCYSAQEFSEALQSDHFWQRQQV
ncbi:hypothetical protein [Acaryochloris marina]|uniref:Uncharacterized protein n=1 Tax=Acaryochloris marina (strain MBIC 11017) TaxID=329726 RepID=B0C267_ACAM1|nr:hypothetical protein [Acaryochloris marina]ABW28519.1 hypothetical protein AM1_3529 [Acaryochloris marina MBIC11017]BDM77518.1 hypothetical protein AM10699_03920 [Acaryochloris marina MBIC10699]